MWRLALTLALAAPLLTPQPPPGAAPRSFDRVTLLEAKGQTSASVSIGDLDGNGTPDLLFGVGRHWPLESLILRNDGKGHFTAGSLSGKAYRTYTAALADLNGDGFLDVVLSNDRPDAKLVYLNDGKGHFKQSGTFGDPLWDTRYVTVADLNGDGRPDLIVANRGDYPEHPVPSFVCLNDGKGAFPSCRPLATESATIIVAADLDGDGKIDLFVPHRDGGQSLIFWNDGSGTFTAPPTKIGPAKAAIRAAAAGDIDGDGKVDLVVGDERTGLFLYLNTGKRTFGSPIPLGAEKASPYSIALGDLDRDGKLDIVVGNNEARGSIFFNRGGAKFQEIRWNDGAGAVYGVAIADLDGDGWPDIAAARSDAPNGIWFNGPRPGPRQ